jgi:hypothetical protein
MAPARRAVKAAARRRAPTKHVPQRPKAIISLQDAKYTSRMNWLVFGQSGIGKTVLAGTAPNSLLVTTEAEGAISAKARGSQAKELKVSSWEDWLEYIAWLEHSGYKEYDWVNLDSLDQLEEHAWNAIMGQSNARSIGGAFRSRSRNDYPLVWSAIADQVERLVRLPTNVLITAKTMRVDVETDEGEDTTLALPLVGSTKRGDLAMKVCGQMTLVGYYRGIRDEETGKKVRRLHTEDSERWVAKDRHDTFGRYVSSPNIARMEKAVEERLASGASRPKKKRRTV